jgi:MFS family permease
VPWWAEKPKPRQAQGPHVDVAGEPFAGRGPVLQGFSTGGEYSRAATYIAEFSPDRTRGFMTSLLNSGSMLGFAVGAGVVAVGAGTR